MSLSIPRLTGGSVSLLHATFYRMVNTEYCSANTQYCSANTQYCSANTQYCSANMQYCSANTQYCSVNTNMHYFINQSETNLSSSFLACMITSLQSSQFLFLWGYLKTDVYASRGNLWHQIQQPASEIKHTPRIFKHGFLCDVRLGCVFGCYFKHLCKNPWMQKSLKILLSVLFLHTTYKICKESPRKLQKGPHCT
jgi:hypothetical protein